jgi:hypothetical protein
LSPSTFCNTFFDLFKDFGIIIAHDGINGGLALRIAEIRKFIHQFEHGGEGIVCDGNGFRPGPHPVHVDVPVTDAVNGILFGNLTDG